MDFGFWGWALLGALILVIFIQGWVILRIMRRNESLRRRFNAHEQGSSEIIDSYEQDFLTLKENLEQAESSALWARTEVAEIEHWMDELREVADFYIDEVDHLDQIVSVHQHICLPHV